MQHRRGNYFVGIFLMALGGWIIASSLGTSLPNWGQIWPVLILVFGLAMLVQSSGDTPRDEGLVFVGVGATLMGAFFFLFTLGVLQWSQMAVYWPTFPLIVGLSYFALYLRGGMRDSGLLVPAFAIGGFGVLAFPFTLGAVQDPLLNRAASFWPVLIVILGLAFLFRPPERKRVSPEPEAQAPPPPDEPADEPGDELPVEPDDNAAE